MTTPIRSADQVVRATTPSGDLEGLTLILSLQHGEYYFLNEVATQIWRLLEQPISIRDVVNNLTSEFDVSHENCETEVLRFVGMLADKGLVNKVTQLQTGEE